MSERLQKVIARAGICSRRKAEDLIVANRVKVNGIVVNKLGSLVNDGDTILIDNKKINFNPQFETYILNKPQRVLSSSSDDRDRVCVVDMIKSKTRLFPIGRLDYYSTGLILISNDGDLMQLLMHPKNHLPRHYHVKIRGRLQDWQIEKIESGLRTKESYYRGCPISNVKIDDDKKITHFDITLFEGRNRQIRKMMEYFHHEVIRLHRFALGPILLDNLGSGCYRKLSDEEILTLKAICKKRISV